MILLCGCVCNSVCLVVVTITWKLHGKVCRSQRCVYVRWRYCWEFVHCGLEQAASQSTLPPLQPRLSYSSPAETLGCLNPQRTKGPVIISTRTGYFCCKWDELLKVNLHIKESSLFSKPPGRRHWCLDPETFNLLMNLNWFLFCKMYDAYAVSFG